MLPDQGEVTRKKCLKPPVVPTPTEGYSGADAQPKRAFATFIHQSQDHSLTATV